MNARHSFAMILGLAVLGTSTSYAAPPSSGSALDTVLPCAMADFEGGAPPVGLGPISQIVWPATGAVVSPAKIQTQQNTWAGTWLGDSHPGALIEAQLFVDKKLASVQDFTARRSTPLVWNATKATKGVHELMLRIYIVDDNNTDSCYLDSAYVYPVVQ
jgi:hypothetical protein